MNNSAFKRISSLPSPPPSQKSKPPNKHPNLRRSLTSHRKYQPFMASSSTKPPSRGGPLAYLTATFYRRGPDSATKEALSEVRKAESALRRVMELDEARDMKQQVMVLEKAVEAVQVLKRRLLKYGELVERVREGERKMRMRMDELELELAETNMRRVRYENEGEEARREIRRVRGEIERRKCVDSEEESGSEDCGKPRDRVCIRTLASGDWDDTLDDEEDDGL